MKKLSLLGVVSTLAISFLWLSCAKEDIHSESEVLVTKKIEYRLDQIPKTKNNQDVIDLLKISQDPDDEKINFHLYNLSLALRELTQDRQFNDVIISLAKNSHNQCASLLDLKDVAPNYYDQINDNLKRFSFSSESTRDEEIWTIQSIADDLTHEPVAPNHEYPETAETEYYYPAIFIPNLEYLDENLQPITSPNIEADPTNDESIEDNIVVWYFSEEGEMNEGLMNEETTLVTSNPLFLLDNAAEEVYLEPNMDVEPFYGMETPEMPEGGVNNDQFNDLNNPYLNSTKSNNFSSNQLSITSSQYRYEASGKSEFTAIGAKHWANNNTIALQYEKLELKKMHQDDIGDLLTTWDFHAPGDQPFANSWANDGNQPGSNVFFQNTYERDFNRSKKNFGALTVGGAYYVLYGRAKYSSEWYTWMPSTMNVHFTRFHWLINGQSYNTNSWKSTLRLVGHD